MLNKEEAMLLAIDTSEQTCSAAIIGDARVIACRSENIGRGHAERLLPLIEELMIEAGVGYRDVKRLAVTTGPGTFTGLRVGLSVARGIALSNTVPCVGLSGLQVLAKQAQLKASDDQAIVHAVITGRSGQGFYQQFSSVQSDGVPCGLGNAINADVDVIAGRIADAPGLVIGSGCSLLRERGYERLLAQDCETELIIDPTCLGLMAFDVDPSQYLPEPLYLRDADAKKAVPLLPIAGAR